MSKNKLFTSLKYQLLQFFYRLRRAKNYVYYLYHRKFLKPTLRDSSLEYQQYLDMQLHRTVTKRHAPLQERTRILIDKFSELVDLTQLDILCVGCRNVEEIKYFRQKGARSVVGIDLYSESPDILVMDMHQMDLPDDHFSVVYSSHSLEHSFNINKVIDEIIRVACSKAYIVVEIPIQFETRGADLVDVGNVKNLQELFQPYFVNDLWSEEVLRFDNRSGTSVAKTIFEIRKDSQIESK